VSAPDTRPTSTGSALEASNASSTSSNATALISTPAPKAITIPTTRGGVRQINPRPAPTSSANPPTKPQNAASHTPPVMPRPTRIEPNAVEGFGSGSVG
jgi:hypothetical protein